MDISKIPIQNRKDEHIVLVSTENVESHDSTWLEHVRFVHNTLPELDLDDINLSCEFLGKSLSAPIIIGAMTGGTELTKKINVSLAKAAQKYRIPMMVGSQRVIIRHPETKESFSAVRKCAPDVPIVGNIGMAQVANSDKFEYIEEIINNINANALAIHLNVIQELVQPEGDKAFSGTLDKIAELKDQIDIPIVIKETGCGISKEIAKKLFNIGIKYIDVAGVGGTSWIAVEYYRAKKHDIKVNMDFGELFWDWGIPTAASIIEVNYASNGYTDRKIIGSGGIRNGIDIAKTIRIGADYAALARPFLMAALEGQGSIDNFIDKIIGELRITMLLTGSKSIEELKKSPIVISSSLKGWLKERKVDFKRL
ncbi:MAG: type 2 isopentenyl-diphosphate Delta-isomerase [Candidatus Lokiarchaeota archaeon]|nr:type 2 isopentenyl-diphosphate Delta-isomerase [Candidatus Lokiarchaeota archaeon]